MVGSNSVSWLLSKSKRDREDKPLKTAELKDVNRFPYKIKDLRDVNPLKVIESIDTMFLYEKLISVTSGG